jgi:ribosomal protein L44E
MVPPGPPLPPEGCIWLSLGEETPPDGFHLEIPVKIIRANCKRPIKYLRFLTWCILSRRVTIHRESENVSENTSEIHNRGIYVVRLEDGMGTQFNPYVIKKQLKPCLRLVRLRCYSGCSESSIRDPNRTAEPRGLQRYCPPSGYKLHIHRT